MSRVEKGRTVPAMAMKNTASLLSLIAPLFSHLKHEDYGHVQRNAAWQDVCAAAGPSLGDALALPSWQVRSSFQDELLVPGMPLAAMPVESLYKPWSSQEGNAFGAARGLYLGDPARHLDAVYGQLDIRVPEAFASMPDHLTLELELLALLLVAENDAAAHQLAADHFDWLGDYDAALADRADMVAHNGALVPARRQNLLDGIAFLRALTALANGITLSVLDGCDASLRTRAQGDRR